MGRTDSFRRCARVLAWVPVLIITAVISWSYYAYVMQLCLFTLTSTKEKVACLLVFNLCFGMFLWAFWSSVCTPPSSPSPEFHVSSDFQHYEQPESVDGQSRMVLEISPKLSVHTRSASGAIRFCHHCRLIKPDRSHHCSVCQMCVLKMDHHCPWLNNCVGFSNYKFFLLFLFFSLLYCLFIAATVTPSFIRVWLGRLTDSSIKLHVTFLTLVSVMFALTLSCLLAFHCWLLTHNKTTLEWMSAPFFSHGPDGAAFDVGVQQNVLQVFGEKKRLWPLPVFSSQGDGHVFPLRRRTQPTHPSLARWSDDWEEQSILAAQEDHLVTIAIDDEGSITNSGV